MPNRKTENIDDLKIGKLMEEFGFKTDSATSTGRALILNLVRSAYGNEAAREFMRQMNLEKNRGLEASVVMDQFKTDRERNAALSQVKADIPGVGTEETQLSLFNVEKESGIFLSTATFLQKKSRRA